MKLVSYVRDGNESWGAVVDGNILDMATASGIGNLADFLGSERYGERDALVDQAQKVCAFEDATLLPVIPRPEKIVCVVRNYLDHHKEVVAVGLDLSLSEQPPIFIRVWRSQCAHNAPLVKPDVSDSLDWEGELAVVIGRGGRNISEEDAPGHIAGYACYNDASVREWQFHAKQIAAGKNFESTGAFGPWLVTADEIPFGTKLKLETRVNGETVQSSDTRHMIFGIAKLISYASTVFTLMPGDVLVTGTPAGVGYSYRPARYLKAGDVCEVQIEHVGLLRNVVVAQSDSSN
ncbi:fumarylacetoacetate hydrolase family protein [Achromobacter sp. NFACC18-2]|uniref:fumarylacetoacetate hydrolase family protein n=1 Tax=Achromobacter sp. NFACC18-2 TaxID=1564112 RepID=UPI0008C05E33|nr:fumarylacetoacetate hydrolase family protein [Achromobacter sp. NFACC18-2]SEK11559.1 2-keto-4-pentenoate hydratase/2-oxohepta-3-ene-1,7-dioic acid hydratase (catechol pathway) [Achromobacter sp. NFACC18-2]